MKENIAEFDECVSLCKQQPEVAPAGFVTVKLSNEWIAEQIGLTASAQGVAVPLLPNCW